MLELRPQSTPTNKFVFGQQTITTRVNVMVPRARTPLIVDVTSAIDARLESRAERLAVIDEGWVGSADAARDDPFHGIEV